MAQRFVRIDLSGAESDFRPVAIEPGLPLLDRVGGNGRIVSRWLGRLVAMPHWQGESVGFLVQDDQAGRLEEVYCQPATREDLQEFLADEMQILQRRMDAIRPASPSEEELAAALRRSFDELTQDPLRTDLDDYFFRYRDANGRWRLVWCWGYQRVDQEAAPAVICSDPDCSLLFLRRAHGRHKCPACQALLAAQPPRPKPWKRWAALALLVLLLLGGLTWWWAPLPRGVQAEVSMLVGEIADVPIKPARSEWREITSQNARVVQVLEGRLVARSQGRTVVDLADGTRAAQVQVSVLPGEVKLTGIDPEKLVVPLDGTLRARAKGEAADKRPLEIAADVLTVARRPAPQFAALADDTLELKGLESTASQPAQTLALRLGEQEVSAPVEVVGQPERIEVLPAGPLTVPAGQRVELQVRAHYAGGRQADLGADRVQWQSDPPQVEGLTLDQGSLTAARPDAGPLAVWARYGDRESNRVEVRGAAGTTATLQLQADPPQPQVGQVGRVTTGDAGAALDQEQFSFQSDQADVLAVDGKTGVFRALAAGNATLRVTHPAAQAAELTMCVVDAQGSERPVAVRILSDQGAAIRLPVGAAFEDFRVEAEYADGMTRLVTRKATLRIPEAPAEAPLAARDGRLLGLRPGQTTVNAEFEGRASASGLTVAVLAELQADEIRLRPSTLVMQPGESVQLTAVGYKDGKSIGDFSNAPGLAWHSSDPQAVRVEDQRATALAPGRAQVTVGLGSLASAAATIEVSHAVSHSLRVDPERMRIHVGERLALGRDLQIRRGDLDVSRDCTVQPASPDVLGFDPATRSLLGLAAGASPVAFGFGDKTTYALVEVLPSETRAKLVDIVVEPTSAWLTPGQALPLQVFGVLSDGRRIDRTPSATLVSSDPNVASIHGHRAYALAPGQVLVTAALPESDRTATAALQIGNEKIHELRLDPPRLELGVGDRAAVRVLGVTSHGAYELFPQRSLTASVGGANSRAVRVDGTNQVEGLAPGQALVTYRFGNLSRSLPVEVLRDAYRELRIEPAEATIRPGDVLSYQVSAWRNGHRSLVPPERVRLSVDNPRVATTEKGLVRGLRVGRTVVRASVGNEQVAGGLSVTRDATRISGSYDRLVLRPDDLFVWDTGWPWLSRMWDFSALWIEPNKVALEVGKQTPSLRAMARNAQGRAVEVPAPLESMDPDILTPLGGARFAARRVGSAQVRVRYGGREAYADVTVSGARFQSITTRLEEGRDTFRVNLDVMAARSEGPLEYRVYAPGETPPARWQPAVEAGQQRRVTLQSPPLRYGDRAAWYQLIIEARDPAGKSVQQYPFGFRLASSIERSDPAKRGGTKSSNP